MKSGSVQQEKKTPAPAGMPPCGMLYWSLSDPERASPQHHSTYARLQADRGSRHSIAGEELSLLVKESPTDERTCLGRENNAQRMIYIFTKLWSTKNMNKEETLNKYITVSSHLISSHLFSSSPCPLIHVKADRPPPKKEQTYSRGGHPKITNQYSVFVFNRLLL